MIMSSLSRRRSAKSTNGLACGLGAVLLLSLASALFPAWATTRDAPSWSALGSGLGGDSPDAYALAYDAANAHLYVGGQFTTAGGKSASRIARWDGSSWSALGSGVGGTNFTLTVYSLAYDAANARLYVGGHFMTAGGVQSNCIASWNGDTWSALGSGTDSGFNNVHALAVDAEGNVYAGGKFTIGEGAIANIAKWSPKTKTWSPLGAGVEILANSPGVVALLLDANGDLYVGGYLEKAGGQDVNEIAKWSPATETWSALGSGVKGDPAVPWPRPRGVFALAQDNDGILYVGGGFALAGEQPANKIAKWDPSTEAWSPLGTGMDWNVASLAFDGAGTLYAGGYFTTAGGQPASSIAKWDGTTWSGLGDGMAHDTYWGPGVESVVYDGGSNLYAGGWFTSAGGTSANNVAKWDGATAGGGGPPLAVDDRYPLGRNTIKGVSNPGVLLNDSGANLTAELVSDVGHGTLDLYPGGGFLYTPSDGFTGTDSFIYRAYDGDEYSNEATVTFTVRSPPVAKADSYSTPRDTELDVTAPGILGNDQSPDDTPLEAIRISGPQYGTLTAFASDGSFTYEPAPGFVGRDSFTYKVDDGIVFSDPATVTITVTRPTLSAEDDFYEIFRNATLTVPAAGILSNDKAPLGVTLEATPVDGPYYGELTAFGADGSFTYEADIGYVGEDWFTYTASNGTEDSNLATVTIRVTNRSPAAGDDHYDTYRDVPLSVAAPGVLGNDSDPDGDYLTAFKTRDPSNGSVVLAWNGSFTYTPAAGFVGVDRFTYRADDGDSCSPQATVTIEVKPLAAWSALGTGVNLDVMALACDAGGTLYAGGNFTAPANRIAKWDGSSWSALGTGMDEWVQALALDANGQLYAGGHFTTGGGVATGRIARWDGSSWSALGDGIAGGASPEILALAIAPDGSVYAGGAFTEAGGTTVSNIARWDPGTATWSALGDGVDDTVYSLAVDPAGNVYAGGLFENAGVHPARNIAKWDGTNWSALGDGMNGVVWALTADGADGLHAGGYFTEAGGTTVNYIAHWNGTAWSGLGGGMGGSGEVPGVRALTRDAAGNLLAGGFFENAGGVAANRIARWDGSAWSPLGAGMDDLVYALAWDAAGFLYAAGRFTVAGGAARSETTAYIAKWDGVVGNHAPEAKDDAYETYQNDPLTVAAPGVLDNDEDADNDPLTVVKTGNPEYGTVVLQADGSFTYTPGARFAGTDSFTYVANDGWGNSNVATVTVSSTGLEAPQVTTQAADEITTTSATGHGTLTAPGWPAPHALGLCWSTTAPPTVADSMVDLEGAASSESFAAGLTGLTSNTLYYVRAYAANTAATAYGGQESFRTLAATPLAPVVSNPTDASLDVAIDTDDSNPAGVGYALRISPAVGGNSWVQADGAIGPDEVWQTAAQWGTTTVTGLDGGTSYAVRAKARNDDQVETALGPTGALLTVPAYGLRSRTREVADGVLIEWLVDLEDGVAQYTVERLDKEAWITVGHVPAGTPDGYSLLDPNGRVAQDHYRIVAVDLTGLRHAFGITHSGTRDIFLELEAGWNLISLPLDAADLTELEGAVVSSAFWIWTGQGYARTVRPGGLEGLWAYAVQPAQVTVRGVPLLDTRAALRQGWNLVGPAENCLLPPGIGTAYAWNRVYQRILESDRPGLIQTRGYWFYSPSARVVRLP